MPNFYTEVIQTDPRFHSTTVCKDLAMLEPITRAAVIAIIEEAESQYGIVLQVTETFRSRERQELLFAQGATQLKDVGVHHFGLAADFCKLIIGDTTKASWAFPWDFLRDLAVKYHLVSGLDWNRPHHKNTFIDADHIQRCDVSRQKDLLSGLWYPDADYVCAPPDESFA